MKIIVDPIEYEIIFTETPKYDDINSDVFGFIDSDNCTIIIKKDLNLTRTKIVILHEILHAMLLKCGLNLKEEDDDLFEQIIECLSHSTLSLIKHNPELIKYLTGEN